MKKIGLSLLFSTALVMNNNVSNTLNNKNRTNKTISSPIICGSLTAAGNAEQNINLGMSSGNALTFSSDSGNIKLQSFNGDIILNSPSIDSSKNYNLLMINSLGELFTANDISPITCGTLIAAGTAGQVVSLGNNSGTINLSATNINKPTAGNYNLLMIDSNGNMATSNNTIPFSCGTLTSETTHCGDLTATSIQSSGEMISSSIHTGDAVCGHLTAAANEGEGIALGNSSGSINLSGTNIKKPISGNYNFLMIDANGNIATSNNTHPFACGILTANNGTFNTITTDNLYVKDSIITGNHTCGSLIAGGALGEVISLGNSSGAINLSATNIEKPSSGNYNLLTIDTNGNILTANSNSTINCGTMNANNLNTAGTLNAGASTLAATSTGSLTAAAAPGQTVNLGNTTGTITIIANNITNPTTGNNSLLMINSSGNIITGNTTNSSLTCGALNATNLTTSGSINAGSISTTGNLNASNTTLGTLNAATNSGQTVTLGNINGSISLKASNISNPPTGNNSLLMINSSGNVITSNTTNSSLTCGNFNASTIMTPNLTASGAFLGNTTIGTLNAGRSADEWVALGNSTGTITLTASNITNPSPGNYSLLMIDVLGRVLTNNTTNSSFTCAGLTSTGALSATSITTSGSINGGTANLGTLNAANNPGQTIWLGNPTGSISLKASNITNPSAGNNSFLMINSSSNVITSNTTNSSLTCGALNATSLTTTGTLNAGSMSTAGTLNAGATTLAATSTGSLTAAAAPGQTVNLGNTTGTITITANNIINPSTGNNSLLMINSSGNIITGNTTNSSLTCGALNATSLTTTGTLNAGATTINTLTTSQLIVPSNGSVALGNTGGGNGIHFSANSGNIDITCHNTDAFLSLYADTNTKGIALTSPQLIRPSAGNNSLLMINSSGNIITGNTTNSSLTCGALNATSLTTTGTLNAGATTINTLTTSQLIVPSNGSVALGNTGGGNGIHFSANSGNIDITCHNTDAFLSLYADTNTKGIALTSPQLIRPSAGNNSFLMINSSGNIITGNTTNSSLTCGALNATSLTTTGTLDAGATTISTLTTSQLIVPSNGSVALGNTGGGNGIHFSANSGNIDITCHNTDAFLSLYADTNTKGIALTSPQLIRPSAGNYNTLYIDQSGYITTNSSSRRYKENITRLTTHNNTFDLLEPVSFYYIKDESQHLQYGFIAEELINIPCLANTVIYDHDGKVESINYQAVFVALTADYLATKKTLQNELAEKNITLAALEEKYLILEAELKNKNTTLNMLIEKDTINNNTLNQLINRCNVLEQALKDIINQISFKKK